MNKPTAGERIIQLGLNQSLSLSLSFFLKKDNMLSRAEKKKRMELHFKTNI